MSPLAATGIIGLNLCGEFGLTGIEEPLLVNGILSSTVYAALIYLAFGGYRLQSDVVLHLSDTPSFARQQLITLAGIMFAQPRKGTSESRMRPTPPPRGHQHGAP